MVWVNEDGLRVRMPGDALGTVAGGEYQGAGATRVIEVELNATSITASAASVGAPYVIVPRNSVIESVEVISETAVTSGGAATLDVGLQRLDGTTAIDADGLVAALALTALNVAGEKNVLTPGATGAGALVGTETAYPGYVTVNYGTAAFTAGRLVVRVNVRVKDADAVVQF